MATADMRDWVRSVAEKAEKRMLVNGRIGRRGNREKDLFTLRARHVKGLFAEFEGLATAINKEISKQAIKCQRALNPKNLGGIEVPDGARLAIEFLDRRVEIVVQPLAAGRRTSRAGRAPRDRVGDSIRSLEPVGGRLVRHLAPRGRGVGVQVARRQRARAWLQRARDARLDRMAGFVVRSRSWPVS